MVTKTGRVTVRGRASRDSELVRSLQQLVPENQHAGLSADHPMMGLVLIFAALLGLFGGWLLAPKDASPLCLAIHGLVVVSSDVANTPTRGSDLSPQVWYAHGWWQGRSSQPFTLNPA